MITQEQVDHFNTKGYLVVENLLDAVALNDVRQEYFTRMDTLYADWEKQGLVKPAYEGMTFWEKLDQCYQGNFDWYQPFDISLPHDGITEETQMHFGPAIFNIVKHKNILDTVEKLIGSEITSNPIQHVRIKPPEHAVPKDEIRAHASSLFKNAGCNSRPVYQYARYDPSTCKSWWGGTVSPAHTTLFAVQYNRSLPLVF